MEWNTRDDDVITGKAPRFAYGIIVCAMRYFTAASAPYYRYFVKYTKMKRATDSMG